MSLPTLTAARIYKGQQAGKSGEESLLTFEEFPYGALSRVSIIMHQLNAVSRFILIYVNIQGMLDKCI